MERINKHKWIPQPGFRTWRCAYCKCERYWDKVWQKIIFVKFGKTYFTTPECVSSINCDHIDNYNVKDYSI
jgi:hypothetical protein